MWKQQLFARKSLERLHKEMEGENRLRRVLGPIALTSLGVGAIIGAGIFVTTGETAANKAGPAVLLSYAFAGMGCALAALCYAEFAAMAPVAGSAYTYAYATLGELLAWIIGWDLVLEYAMSAATVAASWSKYYNKFLDVWHIKMPLWLAYDHWTGLNTATKIIARQMAQAADATLQPGTQAFLDKVSAIISAQSPELVQQAHALLDAPKLFGWEMG